MTNKEILELINEFTERETERHVDSIPSDGIVTLVYSDYEFVSGFIPEIRVDLDVNSCAIKHYVSGILVSEESFSSTENLMYTISSMSFDDMIADCVRKGMETCG